MTFYPFSIYIFSLSRTVFEIFDFKIFRVWPWPLAFGVTLGQKYFHHSKAHIWLSIQLPLTLSLYLVPFFEIFGYRGLEDIIRVSSLPFSSMTSQINIFAFKRFCALQGFRKYKNEVFSPSSSIVIESERLCRASADSKPPLPGGSSPTSPTSPSPTSTSPHFPHFPFSPLQSGEKMSKFFHRNKS